MTVTATDKPLTEQTPVEVDTALYALYREQLELGRKVNAKIDTVHYAADDKRRYGRGPATWTMTTAEATAVVEKIAETNETYVGKDARKVLDALAEARDAFTANTEAQKAHNAEYARRPWTRAFLVTDGHVHRSMNCSTCFPTTEFTWLVDLADHDEAEIVALAGERACTVCYPSAPTLRDFEKASPLFTEEEAQRAKDREQRAADKAKRQADKIAKGLTADGSEFVVSYVEPNAPGIDRDESGKSVHVYRDRERTEHFKTEKAAVMWVVQQMTWGSPSGRYDYQRPAWQAAVEAVAAKHGKPVEQVWQEIEAKVEAKIKRDR